MPSGDSPPPQADRCQNCGNSLEGAFCSRCGQSAADLDLSIGEFTKEFATEALSLDSKFRRTLVPLLIRPGAVPREYVEGRRARFASPVRLYLLASFVMFLVLAFGPGLTVSDVTIDGERVSPVDSLVTNLERDFPELVPETNAEPTPGQRLRERLSEGLQRSQADTQSFSQDFLGRFGQAMFLLLPAFAGLLKLAYRPRLYIHHLVFAVYLHAFIFLLVAAVVLPSAIGLDALGRWSPLALLTVPVYLFFGMQRFYGESWPRTFRKFAFVAVSYGVLVLTTWIAVLVILLLL